MEVRKGYKQTEAGVIPEDWEVMTLENLCVKNGLVRGPFGGALKKEFFVQRGIKVYEQKNAIYRNVELGDYFIDTRKFNELKRFELFPNDFIVSCSGTIGRIYLIPPHAPKGIINQALLKIKTEDNVVSKRYFFYYFDWEKFQEKIIDNTQGGAMKNLVGMSIFRGTKIPLPPTKAEQTAIAAALSDADALIQSLEKLITKKRNIKQGAMQELLKPKEGWVVKKLGEVTDCLDNLRVPLNETQRNQMRGDYPYCGANGVLDFINDYVIDDDIILMAEDGGYFDEYAYRPIAYRMVGKCWVNNHAHILKANAGHDQGFIFYSLVHKNILNYLASGTRAKLNKSEMNKIVLSLPSEKEEQTRIATILSDIDAEIAVLETKLAKYRQIKQGMMQELLTGKTRLV